MLENFRTQKIIWDRANKKIFENIEASSGDSNGRKLVVQVINQEATEVLSGTTLSLGWKHGKGAKGLDAFNVVDASKGIFEIYYTTEMLSNVGDIEASLILIDSTSRIESSTFTISVRLSTVDDESVESENSFTALTEALVKVNDFDAQLTQTLTQVNDTAKKTDGINNVKWWGAKGDGSTDDTTAIQKAFDEAKGVLYFPAGDYKVTGTGEACLTLTRNLSIMGSNKSTIRADNAGIDTSIIKVSFNYNYGSSDVRGWIFKNMSLLQNGGGKHALLISGGFSINSSEISHNTLTANRNNGGYSLYIDDKLAHSEIYMNTFNSEAYLKLYDANSIRKNLFSGTRCAITIDAIIGVRNNVIQDNTIVNRDGAIHIINGSNIRIINNQMEHGATTEKSQNPKKTMIWIEGRNRECQNVVVSENNFGGGTNLDHLIYIENARRTVIEKNYLIAVNVAEVYFGNLSKYNIFSFDNETQSQDSNPRTRTIFKAEVIDNGIGNVGTLQESETLGLQGNWSGGKYYKDASGFVHFINGFSGGSVVEGTVIGRLPVGFRPSYGWYGCVTSGGVGNVQVDGLGNIIVKNLPSNSSVIMFPFQSQQVE